MWFIGKYNLIEEMFKQKINIKLKSDNKKHCLVEYNNTNTAYDCSKFNMFELPFTALHDVAAIW